MFFFVSILFFCPEQTPEVFGFDVGRVTEPQTAPDGSSAGVRLHLPVIPDEQVGKPAWQLLPSMCECVCKWLNVL